MDVSIIICTRNRSSQLEEALQHLLAVRSNSTWEAVIVDNGSTDATRDTILNAARRSERIRYVYEPQPGLGAARDTGWREARGRILCFTDDDCYLDAEYIDKVIEVFGSSPNLGYLGGRILLFDPEDARVTIDEREIPEHYPARSFLPAGIIMGANFSIRREILDVIGGFDRRLGAGTPFPFEDIDIVARAAWHGAEGGFDPRPIVYHHHRRKLSDVPKLEESYDRGRGGYYMKFILRRDSRRAYIKGWIRETRKIYGTYRWGRLGREVTSARQFLRLYSAFAQRLVFEFPLLGAESVARVGRSVSSRRAQKAKKSGSNHS